MKLNTFVRFSILAVVLFASAIFVGSASAAPTLEPDGGGTVLTEEKIVVVDNYNNLPEGVVLVGSNGIYELVVDGERTGNMIAVNPNAVPNGRPTLVLGDESTPLNVLDPRIETKLCFVSTEREAPSRTACAIGS